jgi:hypothetical protein
MGQSMGRLMGGAMGNRMGTAGGWLVDGDLVQILPWIQEAGTAESNAVACW